MRITEPIAVSAAERQQSFVLRVHLFVSFVFEVAFSGVTPPTR